VTWKTGVGKRVLRSDDATGRSVVPLTHDASPSGETGTSRAYRQLEEGPTVLRTRGSASTWLRQRRGVHGTSP